LNIDEPVGMRLRFTTIRYALLMRNMGIPYRHITEKQ
jgi:hypothetical protein